MGIAIHPLQQRIYWVDYNSTIGVSVLNSCDIDGGDVKQFMVQSNSLTWNHSASMNLTDLKIDFRSNNTAFIIDQVETCHVQSMCVCYDAIRRYMDVYGSFFAKNSCIRRPCQSFWAFGHI